MTTLAHSTTDVALDLMASFVLEDGKRWGASATEWQWAAARAHFDPTSAPFNWDGRPRGGRKTTDAAERMAVDLLVVLPHGSTCHAFAADRDQARLLRDCIHGFVQRTPGLSSALVIDQYRVSAPATGSWVEIMSADAASAFGLRSARTVADELTQWPDTEGARTLWQAIVSGQGKVPGAKLTVTTTAGSPGSWTHRIYLSAKASPLWRVVEIPGPLPWVSAEFLDDQRAQLLPSAFARLHLNEWHQGEDKLTDPGDLERCIVLDGPQGPEPHRRYIVTADLGIVHDASVVCVSHAERTTDSAGRVVGRRVVLDQLRVWRGTRRHPVQLADVEAAITEFAHQFGARVVVCDPHEAVSILQNLRTKGVAAEPFLFTAQSVGRLALALYQAIKSGALAIWRHDDLVAELLNVRLVEKGPGQFRLDHASSGHDDMAVCLAMATATLLERPVSGNWSHLFYARQCPACRETVPESSVECPKCSTALEPPTPTPASENVWAAVYGTTEALERSQQRTWFGGAAGAGQGRGWFG